jgi:uncharacterized protein YndB with AHSA1/START domain
MATESVHVSALIPARPQDVYDAWLSSEQHAKMTGGGAQVEPHVGGAHRAWDDYITGKTVELYPGKRIVQTWRTLEFPSESGDSQIAVTFSEESGHTRVTIAHTDIPEGQGARYESGWADHYFTPMTAYFSSLAPAAAAPKKAAPRKAAAKKAAPKKVAAKKGAAKKVAPKKGAAKKAAPKKAAPKKAAPKKGAAKKAAAKKVAPKKTAKKAVARAPVA